jgi:hypothetical protein
MQFRTREIRHEGAEKYTVRSVAAFQPMREGELMRKEAFGPEDVARVIESTPLTDEDRELRSRMPLLEAIAACSTIRMGEAVTVEEALRDWIERRAAHERALEHRRMFQVVDDASPRKDAQKPTDGGSLSSKQRSCTPSEISESWRGCTGAGALSPL